MLEQCRLQNRCPEDCELWQRRQVSRTTFSTGGFDKVKALGKSAGTIAPRKKDDWASGLLVSRQRGTKSKVTPGLISWCPPTSWCYYWSAGHSHQHLKFEFTFLAKINFTYYKQHHFKDTVCYSEEHLLCSAALISTIFTPLFIL